MLELKNIVKEYITGETKVEALKGVSLSFRESEFVSILGQSGCGKTTLLNIVGGLDKYTSGDLVIDGVSTKEYADSDWDVYRNHKVGFVFQSYNLIPHQTVLSNVELALTLSGVSKKERREKAIEALEKVGLGDQINKKPNQMSGGQMQRVAIARALVNDPEILLADEPTGALDSETSVQIMELLKEISKDKLIIMVTHNPEIAEKYSTRIIKLLDGKIISDSDEFSPEKYDEKNEKCKKLKSKKNKAKSMSFFTALSLSFNNLLTKKARTFLTSFAGSIGIIGIALILSVSSGVQIYIDDVQEDTLSSYPITIEAESVDATELMKNIMGAHNKKTKHKKDRVYSSSTMYDMLNAFSSTEKNINNLSKFKTYIEDDKNGFNDNLTAVQYSYDLKLNIYTKKDDGEIVKSDISELMNDLYGQSATNATTSMSSQMMASSPFANMDVWSEMLPGMNNEACSPIVSEQYDVIYGKLPQKFNEIVLIVNSNNEVSDLCLYALGLTSSDEMKKVMQAFMNGEEVETKAQSWSYKEICDMKFKVILASDFYSYDSATKTYRDISKTDAGLKTLYNNGINLKVTGILRPKDDSSANMMEGAIGYTSKLTKYVVEKSKDNSIIKKQQESPKTDVFSGLPFKPEDYEELSSSQKAEKVREYFEKVDIIKKAALYPIIASIPTEDELNAYISSVTDGKSREEILEYLLSNIPEDSETDAETMKAYFDSLEVSEFETAADEMLAAGYAAGKTAQVQNAIAAMTTNDIAAAFDLLAPTLSEDNLAKFYDDPSVMPATMSSSTYSDNLKKLGYVDLKSPKRINLYSSTFEQKDSISEEIDKYNKGVKEEDKINYTDYIALLMSSITTIINSISYVLIAFVAISLIVSSIMIGIITYISVLERTKEIGVLRSIGASKRDVSRVFNAETMIVGFAAGAIGIIVSLACNVLINVILYSLTEIENLKAVLPVGGAIILVAISVILTLIAGLIPSKIAAKKDPVEALRTE